MGLWQQITSAVKDSFLELIRALIQVLPAIGAGMVVLCVFWVLAVLVRRLARVAAKPLHDDTARRLVEQVSYYLVWTIGILVTLKAAGMNLETMATTLGLGGVAIGFALKDILSNLVSGVLLLAMRPFQIGDQIAIGDTEGTVESIELRATQIRTYDGRLVLIPNADIFTSRITNNTASPFRRVSIFVHLAYREDAARALSVMLDSMKSVPGIASTPPPSTRLRDFVPDGVQLEARFWAESRRAELMQTAAAARTP